MLGFFLILTNYLAQNLFGTRNKISPQRIRIYGPISFDEFTEGNSMYVETQLIASLHTTKNN